MIKNRLINSLVMLMVATPLLWGGSSMVLAADTLVIEKTYETTNKDDDGTAAFEQTQEKDGKTYTLQEITVTVQDVITPKREILTLEGEVFVGDPEANKPLESVERDGKKWELKETELVDSSRPELTKEVSTVIPYKGVEYIDTLPEIGSIDVLDENTKQTINVNIPYQSHEEVDSYWNNNFSFSITVAIYDADSYWLGDLEIPNDADLILYDRELLEYLELPQEYYRIQEISWDGDSYESNGELRRDATASGSKLVKDIDVSYAGKVTFPAVEAQYYNSIYVEQMPSGEETENDTTIYVMSAKGSYLEDVDGENSGDPGNTGEETKKSFLEWLLDWIINHPILSLNIGLAIIIFAIILILFAVKKREKNRIRR